MKKLALILLAAVMAGAAAAAQVPATVHAVWTPNPAADGVVQYSLSVDGGAAVITLPATCTPTLCSQVLTIPTFGLHTVTLVAQNYKISGDPTTIQSSAVVSATFTLASAPTVSTGFVIKN